MHERFQELTPRWFHRAHVYVGSIGPCFHDFRYRFAQDAKASTITASVYTNKCFELAEDVETQEFPWDEAGVEALKQWLDQHYQHWCQTDTTSCL